MKRGWILLALVLGAGAGVAQTLPLAWVTGDALDAADPDAVALGTVWDGHIAHIDGLPPIATSLEGTAVRVSADDPSLRLAGLGASDGLSDVSLALPVRALSRFDGRLAGLAGTLEIDIQTLTFDDGTCMEAVGQARTDVLALNRGTWNWAGPNLEGPVSCREGDVVVNMQGQDANGTVGAEIAISPTGPYRTQVTIRTTQPEAGIVLPLFGFQNQNGAWTLSESGSWQ